MSTWKVIFATLVIFATGLVIGGLVVDRAGVTAPAVTKAGPNGNNGQFRLQSLQSLQRRMDRELGLTPEQDDQIKKIIAASQEHVGEVWKPVADAVAKETQDACDQIRAVLTPEQRAKFDSLPRGGRGDFGERGERGWHRGPGGPGGPTNHFQTNRMTNRFPPNFQRDRGSAPTSQ